MKFTEISELIEQNRILTGMSSLPFAAEKDSSIRIFWFNFDVSQKDTGVTAEVYTIFSIGEDMAVESRNIDFSVDLILEEGKLPELDEKEYMYQLQQIYEGGNLREMVSLIEKAALKPLIPVYFAVIKEYIDR